jgi:hypothetical protein
MASAHGRGDGHGHGLGTGVGIIILGGVNDDAAFGLHRTT